jgi:N-acetylneuraminate synthase/sialic acid synthase
MVRDLHRVRVATGDGVKRVYETEVNPMVKMGKKICAARDLPQGYTIQAGDLAIKSPGGGLPPYEMDKIIGRTTRFALKADDDITFEVLNGAEIRAEAAS